LKDFATVAAGYVVGHGVLRMFAGLLNGLGDGPRAELLLRWMPVWNALGIFVLAWGLYRVILWLPGWLEPGPRRLVEYGPIPSTPPIATPASGDRSDRSTALPESASQTTAAVDVEWKPRLKALQKRRDVPAMLDLQRSLVKNWPQDRAARLDRRLGRWYTKHFQHMMLNGRVAEAASDVERVAEHYASSEEFAYFREILPVVRQCAELKQSLQEEE
jgi:hypothetical protein